MDVHAGFSFQKQARIANISHASIFAIHMVT